MELRHLRYFIAVAEALHFGRAAKRLHISQPPLSQQIMALEQELGVTLFERTQRSVALTTPGRLFLVEAYKTVQQAEQAILVARRAARGEVGQLRIGFVSTAAFGNLPLLVRRFRSRHPEVTLELQELPTSRLLEQIQSDSIDLGFFRLDPESIRRGRSAGLEVLTVQREVCVVALSEVHPLASLESIALEQLATYGWVFFPRPTSPTLYDQVFQACRQAGFEPRVVQEATLMQTILSLVAADLGVTVAPASLQNLQRAGLLYRPLSTPPIYSEMLAVWRTRDPSPVLAAFVEMMREVVAAEFHSSTDGSRS